MIEDCQAFSLNISWIQSHLFVPTSPVLKQAFLFTYLDNRSHGLTSWTPQIQLPISLRETGCADLTRHCGWKPIGSRMKSNCLNLNCTMFTIWPFPTFSAAFPDIPCTFFFLKASPPPRWVRKPLVGEPFMLCTQDWLHSAWPPCSKMKNFQVVTEECETRCEACWQEALCDCTGLLHIPHLALSLFLWSRQP